METDWWILKYEAASIRFKLVLFSNCLMYWFCDDFVWEGKKRRCIWWASWAHHTTDEMMVESTLYIIILPLSHWIHGLRTRFQDRGICKCMCYYRSSLCLLFDCVCDEFCNRFEHHSDEYVGLVCVFVFGVGVGRWALRKDGFTYSQGVAKELHSTHMTPLLPSGSLSLPRLVILKADNGKALLAWAWATGSSSLVAHAHKWVPLQPHIPQVPRTSYLSVQKNLFWKSDF